MALTAITSLNSLTSKIKNMAKDISRRSFLKALGGGAVASSSLLAACTDGPQTAAKQQEPEQGKLTYRANPGKKASVSR